MLLARDDVAYILDTFPIVRRKDEAEYGEYRTQRVILAIYDALAAAQAGGPPYRTPLDPPPAHGPPAPAAEEAAPPAVPWRVGDRVRHPQFGSGRITAILPRAADAILTVAFDTGRPRRLLARLAELERA